MMYFPELYPDELLYSWLTRYYVQGGYVAYRFCAEDLYMNPNVKPSIEFINPLTPFVLERLTKEKSVDEIIMKHTMYPYYARFLPKKRRNRAFEMLVKEQRCGANVLPLQKLKNGESRFLRFCPLCVQEDREKYGETYWHRMHQLIGIHVCPVHGCKLHNSEVQITSMTSPALISAEAVAGVNESAMLEGTELEIKVATYVRDVFEQAFDLEADMKIGDFLYSRMANTKYVSKRGKKRYMALFHQDFMEYCKELPGNWFTEQWQLQKILNNYRWNFYEICLVAMFLQIPAEEFADMKLPEIKQQQLFDEDVKKLHGQGLNYRQIADVLDTSYDVVKAIGCGCYGTYHYTVDNPQKGGSKRKDWEKLDWERLPLVRDTIRKLQGMPDDRPQRITVGTVERMLQLHKKALEYCPLCVAEIMKYQETQERFWAREIIWAIKKLVREEKTVHWTGILKLTNIRMKNVNACISDLNDQADDEVRGIIKELLLNGGITDERVI